MKSWMVVFRVILLFLPFLIVGYQGCGQGFSVVSESDPSFQGIASFDVDLKDKLNGFDMELKGKDQIQTGVEYYLKVVNLKAIQGGSKVVAIHNANVASVPAANCSVNKVGKETKPEGASYVLSCRENGIVTFTFDVELEDGTKGVADSQGITIAAKTQKNLAGYGKGFYDTSCSSCHRELSQTDKPDKSPDQVKDSLGPKYTTKMNTQELVNLTAYQIRTIAAALAKNPADDPLPGLTISSPAAGSSVSQQAFKLTAKISQSSSFTPKTVKIFLDGSQVGADGASLPNEMTIENLGPGKHDLYVKAFDAAGRVVQSPTTSFVVDTSGGGGALDGAKLYVDNGCVPCHGAITSNDIKVKTRAAFDNAIKNIQGMAKYSNLTNEQRDAIAKALK